MVSKDGIRTFSRYVAEEVRASNICVVTFSPRVPIVTEDAPEEAFRRLPGPEILGARIRSCRGAAHGTQRWLLRLRQWQVGERNG